MNNSDVPCGANDSLSGLADMAIQALIGGDVETLEELETRSAKLVAHGSAQKLISAKDKLSVFRQFLDLSAGNLRMLHRLRADQRDYRPEASFYAGIQARNSSADGAVMKGDAWVR